MTVLVIRHRVRDYGQWRALFDEDADVRQAHGSQSERVFHGVADADEVLVYLEWDDAERAQLFARSVDLRDAMVYSGVVDHPDIWILKEVDRSVF
jgi:heme-degrading monooxygenase HmoA